MPPQPYIDQWIRLAVRGVHETNNFIYGFNLRGPVGRPTEAQLIGLCSNFWTNFGAQLAALHGTQFIFTNVEATDRYDTGGAYGNFVPVVNAIGTKATDAVPANVAHVISWNTGLSGRSYQGRTYLTGWTDVDYTQSILSSANITLLSNLAQSLITWAGPIGTAVDFVVASIKLLSLQSINGYTIDNVADSQRRRLPGRGF